MTKTEYFTLIKTITKDVRQQGFNYKRIFSEKRIGMNGYRTKLWWTQDSYDLAAFINVIYGDKVTADVYRTKPNVWTPNNFNVRIIPNERVRDEKCTFTEWLSKGSNGK